MGKWIRERRQKHPTYHELRRAAKKAGATIEVDHDTTAYRATARRGHCWESGLHELVSPWSVFAVSHDPAWKAEARGDLYDRIVDYGTVEPCTDADCDWCRPSRDRCSSASEGAAE